MITVVGSGIAAQQLSPADTGRELLENATATGTALIAIILAVGSVSDAHVNPVVSIADAVFRGLRVGELAAYVVAQLDGAVLGAYITGAYFFTSSNSFANPAVTLARTLSDTFCRHRAGFGDAVHSCSGRGTLLACVTVRLLWPRAEDLRRDVVVPHGTADVGTYEVEHV